MRDALSSMLVQARTDVHEADAVWLLTPVKKPEPSASSPYMSAYQHALAIQRPSVVLRRRPMTPRRA